MTKRKILFALSLISVLMLNFMSRERAEESISDIYHTEYKEYFNTYFPTDYYTEKTHVKAQSIIDVTSRNMAQAQEILSPHSRPHTVEKHTVDATIYKALHPMTDITASGITLDTVNAGKYRIIAVSRDLAEKGFSFGTRVMISGTGTHDGIWVVEDLMHQRWQNRIDFLSDADAPLDKWENVTMVKID